MLNTSSGQSPLLSCRTDVTESCLPPVRLSRVRKGGGPGGVELQNPAVRRAKMVEGLPRLGLGLAGELGRLLLILYSSTLFSTCC